MEIIFRPLKSDRYFVGFNPSLESDTITATANPGCWAPLEQISKKFNWNQTRIHGAATRVMRFSKLAVLQDLEPKLILLPKTSGNKDVTEIIDDLIEAAESIDSEIVNFTHYGYVRERLPTIELESVFRKLAENKRKISIRVIIFDIDARYHLQINNLYKRTSCQLS
jgi:hypothetical protein